MKLCTIGSSGKGLRRFSELLTSAQVDCVIDVRLNNTSQLAGYSKKDDLEYVLELLKVAYEHHPELAPTEDLLKGYRADKDWEAYVQQFSELMVERDMLSEGREIISRWQRPCLLCSEDKPDMCHRRLIAEHWEANLPDMEVVHLR